MIDLISVLKNLYPNGNAQGTPPDHGAPAVFSDPSERGSKGNADTGAMGPVADPMHKESGADTSASPLAGILGAVAQLSGGLRKPDEPMDPLASTSGIYPKQQVPYQPTQYQQLPLKRMY